ncbi:hypothetical protein B5E58_11870 [Tyzzerella sp. An114]|mgnify:CR=1 FL=1|uniref:DNA mismatch repair endonuclease MutL n=1 Tax=Tyzzerella sp. An114 TaxID=1965545 RepID=UPI000B42DEBD|nr:DNA mismatch repair endonuclease MutL [Tyzzerella sp. An114]OUQ55728.1 hypothetical protein B5E58_11870 [Tyzzerella sp. An114]
MSKIKLLDTNTINKIAAGEVVERPSSVVKELVENSIDAGASAITIEIKNGGTTFIRVSDNGKGIERNDIKIAFLSHATSKINDIEDLDNIFSLGFRGEALASIAAVSQIEMITKTHSEEEGTKININGGEIIDFQEWGSVEGTSISVNNLFYNVPARRKFLKKPNIESGYISDIINKIALGHPEVSIKYINNGTTILYTSGNSDLKTVVFSIYGKDNFKKMLDINCKIYEYSLNGLIGKPELSRSNRNYQNLFINGRYIKSNIISNAVEDAYKTRLLTGKFPIYVLNLNIPPSSVDVNVHPTKLEVRFDDEDKIYEFVYNSVLDILNNNILIPEVSIIEEKESRTRSCNVDNIKEEYIQPSIFNNSNLNFQNNKNSIETKKVSNEEDIFFNKSPILKDKTFSKIDQLLNDQKQNNSLKVKEDKEEYISKNLNDNKSDCYSVKNIKEEREPFFNNYKIVGQIFNTYWIVEQNGSIFYIDQHAAHERILFEKYMNNFKNQNIVSQKLLSPEIINISEKEKTILKENKEWLLNFGFEIEIVDKNAAAIKAVPYIFNTPQNSNYFYEILDIISDKNKESVYDTKIHDIATAACKAAVKANDKLSFQETHKMISELLKLENPFNCPHGRPTIIEITKYELEKLFKRIQN